MNAAGLTICGTYGFRSQWLDYYFKYGDELWEKDILNKLQKSACKLFLRQSGIISKNNKITRLGKKLKKLGADDINVWAIIFINLSYNSQLIKTYVSECKFNATIFIEDLKKIFGDKYNPTTINNAVNSLKQTLKFSPIGSEIGAGICNKKGTTIVSIKRIPWQNPNALVILYSLYKFANKCNSYYSFSLSIICSENGNFKGISPSRIFGLSYNALKEIIQELSALSDKGDFLIKSSFNKDLDNVELNNKKCAYDILKLL